MWTHTRPALGRHQNRKQKTHFLDSQVTKFRQSKQNWTANVVLTFNVDGEKILRSAQNMEKKKTPKLNSSWKWRRKSNQFRQKRKENEKGIPFVDAEIDGDKRKEKSRRAVHSIQFWPNKWMKKKRIDWLRSWWSDNDPDGPSHFWTAIGSEAELEQREKDNKRRKAFEWEGKVRLDEMTPGWREKSVKTEEKQGRHSLREEEQEISKERPEIGFSSMIREREDKT